MTSVLGISAFYHDSAAAIIVNGEIIAAAQEERFTRKKHDASYPKNAINYVLKESGLKLNEVDHLVFLTVTIIKPNLFTFLNKLWIKFGILLGKIISPVVMGLVFFFVVTPIGILVRILKKDVMGLKRGTSSYWINREDKVQSMKKQF